MSRGRTYQRQGCVHDLVISKEGRLLASVQGRKTYITSVGFKSARKTKNASPIQSQCTCPVGDDGCKHAVAVVAMYLQMLGDKHKVPLAKPDDSRWVRLADDTDSDEGYDMPDAFSCDAAKMQSLKQDWDQKIRQHLETHDHQQLLDLLESLIERFPELHQEFKEQIMLSEGDVEHLLSQARQEIRQIATEPGWRNHWNDEGHTPNYEPVRHRLERLVALGHCDAVTKLGRELIEQGLEQVAQSHDEGETAMELATCLSIVFDAVARSSLSNSRKILFAIDACLQDDYGVIDDEANTVLKAKYASSDWSAVADDLARRLPSKGQTRTDDYHHRYTRDSMTNWLAHALEKAQREDEVLAVYEREAILTNSYERLVRFLVDHDRDENAQRWAMEGIEKNRENQPGFAFSLASLLCELAQRRKQWHDVAAHAAQKFFNRPSRPALKELVVAAGKAKCKAKVRQAALEFLETGLAPVRIKISAKGKRSVTIDDNWPLPLPDHLVLLMRPGLDGSTKPQPHYEVLLDIAIADKCIDDVLRWYDQLDACRSRSTGSWRNGMGDSYADRVAEVVAKSHPQRALDIYDQRLEANLKDASGSAYEACAAYLRKMKPIMKSLGRQKEWTQQLADIRLNYRRRPRFMEVLDKLDGRTILQTHQGRASRP